MLYKDILKNLSKYLFVLALVVTIPLGLSLYYQFVVPAEHPQPHVTWAFLETVLIIFFLSFICHFIGRDVSGTVYRREGLILVVLIWFLSPILGGLPFYLSGTLKNPVHAIFEATSGFTTTGATILQAKAFDENTRQEIPIKKEITHALTTTYTYWGTVDPVEDPKTGKIIQGIEAVPKALLFWRSFMQWLGGMGVMVLFVAILPALGVGGRILFVAEVPGPLKDSLTPRLRDTAIQLWSIYIGLSLIEVALLMITNQKLSLFEAITITFSTISTGGFSVKNSSIGAYHNVFTDWIVIAFMILGATNFSFYFYSLRGKFFRVYEPEFFLFLSIIILGTIFSAFYIVGTEKILLSGQVTDTLFSWTESIRVSCFQLVSCLTTTGFAKVSYESWPYALQAMLLIFSFIGGMSGSTAGGLKIVRLYMVFRTAQYKVESLFAPQTVRRFSLGGKEIDVSTAMMVLSYFVIAIGITCLGVFIYIIDGIDPETAISTSVLMLNSVGIGFRMASPSESFLFLDNFGLIFSAILMLIGRLEFLAVLAILVPSFWYKSR